MPKHLTIKDPRHEIQLFIRRAIVIAIIISILSAFLVARLIYLQIYQHRLYTTLSQKNLLNLAPLEPNRGLIYDRHGILLADNTPVFSLELIPNHVLHLKKTLSELGQIITLSKDELHTFRKLLRQHRRFETIPLRTRLTEEEVARFAVNQYRFPGVQVKAHLIRHYPFGPLMAPVLGYVGRMNEQELQAVDMTNYSATNFIGKIGVEKYFENQLHGIVGYEQAESDAAGRIVRVLKRTDPEPGKNIYLTIDSHLQTVANAAFQEEHGALVAIDPRNGQVLALVSNPSYDPNLFVDGINSTLYRELQNDPARPLYNRAVRGQFPLASTIKPFLGLEGLDSGVINTAFQIFDPGWFRLKNNAHIYHDWKRTGHGTVNISNAIRISCDTFFFTLAIKMGITRIDTILDQFGFGKRTMIEMDEELAGLVPSPEWKKRTQNAAWYPGDTLNIGIGQGFVLATPLQSATAIATLANRGQPYKPTLLLGIQSNNRFQYTPASPLPHLPFKIANWQIVADAMQSVMTNGTGLTHFGKGQPYTVAGKTGTAQMFHLKQNEKYHANLLPKKLRDNSLFIAFAPVDNPRIAVAVMAEHSDIAGSIARKVLDSYLIGQTVHAN